MRESGISLYPVSVEWEPPFTMLTTLRGAGDLQVRVQLLILTPQYGHTMGSSLPLHPCNQPWLDSAALRESQGRASRLAAGCGLV